MGVTSVGGGPVRFRVGIHSGLVALRKVRRVGRSRLDTVGATVHIAAKLQQSAPPGGILISAEAVRLCRSRLDLTPSPVPPVLDRVTAGVFGLDRPPHRRSSELEDRYSGAIIGRQPELARLRKSLPRRGGSSAALAIVGEPGIGKSRLAAPWGERHRARRADPGLLRRHAEAHDAVRDCPPPDRRGAGAGGRERPDEARAALAAVGLESWEMAAVHASLAELAEPRRARIAA